MKVNFYLPGLRKNFPINVMFIRLLKEHPEFFREGVEIGACYGEFPPSLWNGGRVSRPDMCDEKFINMCINTINGLGVPLRYTYTNMVLEEKDLSDPYCNYCLKAAYNDMNGVILVSPILEEYVRKHFPKMKIISSTCKGIRGIDGVNNELAKGYDMVVLDYNLNNQYEELEKIKTKKDKTIHILQFAKMSEVNMIYYEKDYYAIPENGAEKAYELLRQALLSEKKVAIAKTVMGTNEKLLVLYPMKDGMIVKTLFYNDEIASVPKQVPKMKLEEQEMAKLLIQNMTKAFDAEEYRDEYQARLRDAIMKKIQGQEIVTADTSDPDNVIDLMEALKKSLDMTKKDPSGSKNKRGTA